MTRRVTAPLLVEAPEPDEPDDQHHQGCNCEDIHGDSPMAIMRR